MALSAPFGINFRTDGAPEVGEVGDFEGDGPGELIEPGGEGQNANYSAPRGYGWCNSAYNVRYRSSLVDRRLCGLHWVSPGEYYYQIDLADGPGAYLIELASGSATGPNSSNVELFDGPFSAIGTGTPPVSLGVLAAGDTSTGGFKDAQDDEYSAAAWPGSQAPISRTFTTGYALLRVGTSTLFGGITHIAFSLVGGGDATAPTITGPGGATGGTSSTSIVENTTAVHTFTADETVTWDLNGGADVARFAINSTSGALSFSAAPNYESPNDADTNNTYVVGVRATDAASNATTQTVTVTVTDANEAPTFSGTISVPNLAVGFAMTPIAAGSSYADQDVGDTAAYAAVGTWPAGVTVNSSTGTISGTPTVAGTYSGLQVRRTDSGSLSVLSNTFSIVVEAVGTATISDWVNNTGTPHAGLTGVDITFLSSSMPRSVVLNLSNRTIDGGADLVVASTALVAGTTCHWIATKADQPTWFGSGSVVIT